MELRLNNKMNEFDTYSLFTIHADTVDTYNLQTLNWKAKKDKFKHLLGIKIPKHKKISEIRYELYGNDDSYDCKKIINLTKENQQEYIYINISVDVVYFVKLIIKTTKNENQMFYKFYKFPEYLVEKINLSQEKITFGIKKNEDDKFNEKELEELDESRNEPSDQEDDNSSETESENSQESSDIEITKHSENTEYHTDNDELQKELEKYDSDYSSDNENSDDDKSSSKISPFSGKYSMI